MSRTSAAALLGWVAVFTAFGLVGWVALEAGPIDGRHVLALILFGVGSGVILAALEDHDR